MIMTSMSRAAGNICRIIGFSAGLFAASHACAQAPLKLRVGNLKFSASVDLWLAVKNGMFAKNGLEVTLTDFRNGQECVAAQQANSVDICLLIPGIAMQANERGFDLTVVAQNETAKTQGPDSGSIVVLKDSPFQIGRAHV